MFSKKEQWAIFGTVNALAVLAVVLFPLYKRFVDWMPPMTCNMVEYLHLYCPACGGTRALEAFLSFDLLESLYYNPIVVICAGLFVAYEIAMIRALVRKERRGTFLRIWLLFAVLGVWFAFFVVRNILLACGFDMLGDILISQAIAPFFGN